MNTAEAITLFGSVKDLASALGLTVQAIYQWGDTVPPLRVYQIRELLAMRDGQHEQNRAAA